MKLTYFPNGSSSRGNLCDMGIRLGNFQQVLDVERFTSANYISKNKFTKTRFSLSKEKLCLQEIRDLCPKFLLKDDGDDDDDDDDDDNFELDFVSPPSSNNATSAGSKKLKKQFQNVNRVSDINTGL